MDLKDVIRDVYANAAEAHAAFHAGHHDTAEHYLAKIGNEIDEYVPKKPMEEGDVTKSATSETEKGKVAGAKVEDPGPAEQTAAVDPAEAAQEIGSQRTTEKPTR